MSGYLLDTYAVSELTKENPNPAVIDYLNAGVDLTATRASEVLEFTTNIRTCCEAA